MTAALLTSATTPDSAQDVNPAPAVISEVTPADIGVTQETTAPEPTQTEPAEKPAKQPKLFHAVASANSGASRTGAVTELLRDVFSHNLTANASQDGVDHINVGFHATTPLGKKLYLNAKVEPAFKYEIAEGNVIAFASIGGAWNFILSGGKPALAMQWGAHAANSATRFSQVRVPKFLLIMSTVVWTRISSDPELMHNITNSRLPFECYEPGATTLVERHRHSYSEWYVRTLELIRDTLIQIKEEKNPNLVPDFAAAFDNAEQKKRQRQRPHANAKPRSRMENRRV